MDLRFFRSKKVFITGHTGFKGSWLTKILLMSGAQVTGYALLPPKESLFNICSFKRGIKNYIGDIRDYKRLRKAFERSRPEIVIHMAAQPLVIESYKNPAYTYDTNVMGTVNILECVRHNDSVKSFLNVTTDKVYENKERTAGYKENEPLDGYDPYSNSKSCSELVTHSYKKSFFENSSIAISTARSGNVIGGGDFSADRIIPDCIRAAVRQEDIIVRNPRSIRPYQHVLEPLFAYLLIIQKQCENRKFADYYNVGPDDRDCVATEKLVKLFCDLWGGGLKYKKLKTNRGFHEAGFLKLNNAKIKRVLGWYPHWNIEDAVRKTAEWTKVYYTGGDAEYCMEEQIKEFMKI